MKTIAALFGSALIVGCAGQFHAPPPGWYEQNSANNNAATAAYMQTLQQSRPNLTAAPQMQPGGAVAVWTGNSRLGQSVTGAAATHCEYFINGQKFWRSFSNFCPSSLQVQ